MLRGFAVLLLSQLVGEASARALALPVPGPVIGLALLAAILLAFGRAGHDRLGVGPVADHLLASLGLLFVPAGVGVVRLLPTLGEHAAAIAAVVVLSTTLTMLVTVGVFLLVKRLQARGGRG